MIDNNHFLILAKIYHDDRIVALETDTESKRESYYIIYLFNKCLGQLLCARNCPEPGRHSGNKTQHPFLMEFIFWLGSQTIDKIMTMSE